MSWVRDITDNLISNLREHGQLKGQDVKERSIRKGLTEDFPHDIAQRDFPVIRVIWTGTTEEDEPGGLYPERRVTLNYNIFCAVYAVQYEDRYDKLADLCEAVADVLYSEEPSGFPNLDLDDINIRSVEVAPDVLTEQAYAVAILDVGFTCWTARADRKGK